jgi:hypothetical protein
MNRPDLDADLAAALEVLAARLGPLQVLKVYPAPPRPPVAPPAAAAGGPKPAQPGLFDLDLEPTSPATDPYRHIPPRRRRDHLHDASGPLSPLPSTWRNSL